MQKLIFVFVMLMGAFGFSSLKAQIAPTNSGIFFQAVARDNYSNPAKDRTVYVEASIIQNAANGTKVLTELFQTTTDGLGVFSISIGSGTRIGGTLSGLDKVDWANGPYFLGLKIAIKPLSPVTNWDYTKELIDLGASAFGTVPYAFYSAGTASVKDQVKTTDTAAMLLPYAKKTDLALKVNLADSSTIYVTPTQLRAVKFDTTSIYASLNQKEILANKSTNVTTDATSDVKYPSVRAVKSYVDLQFSNFVLADGSVTTAKLADGAVTDAKIVSVAGTKVTGDIAGNAATATLAASATKLATPRTINGVAFDGTSNITIATGSTVTDADATTKGVVQLAGDLTGTAAQPRIANGAVTDAKIVSVAGAKVTGDIAGNAATATLAANATKLATPRTINGVAFDGTSNITIATGSGVTDADATTKGVVQLAGDLTGTAAQPRIANGAVTDAKIVSVAGAKVTGDIAGNAATATLAANATNAVNATNATLAANATKLATPRTINGVAFDGTSNITIATGSNPIDADANTKGIVQLAGDLTGTAAQPRIANGAVTDAKIADVAASKITGAVSVANGGTGATTAAGARTNLGLVIGTDILAQRTFGSAANNSTSDFIAATEKGANNGVATLGNDGKIPSTQIPAISFQSASVVANQAAMLALANQQVGSIAIRTDNNKNYVLSTLPATTLANWIELATPSSVTSVNGNAGPNVVLTAADIAGVELSSNKSNDVAADAASTTKFPTVKSIKDYVDQQSANAGVADNSITSAKINGAIAIAKGGTGATTAAGARANLGLVIGTDVMSATATTTLTGDVTGSGNGSFATTVNSIGGVSSTTIATLPTSINANTASITANTNNISSLTTSVNANTASITAEITRATNAEAALDTRITSNAVSITTNTADILLKAPINSPTFTGTPTAPTPATSDNSTKVATTEFVQANLGTVSAGTLTGTTLASTITGSSLTSVGTITSGTWSGTTLAVANGGTGATTAAGARTNLGLVIGTDVMSATATTTLTGDVTGSGNGSFATTVNSVGGVSSSTIATLPTSVNANTASITANTADILLKAPINSPTFTGTPTAPTPATSDNSTKIATTEYVKASITASNAGLSSIGAISGTSNANGATISGTTQLILTPADATNGGVVTTGAQTFAGAKTFSNTANFLTDITVNGLTVGKGGGNISSNTAIGLGALALNTTGSGSTAFGNKALSKSTGGTATAFGASALENLTIGTGNVAIGYAALNQTTSQNSNTAVGDQAMRFSTGASNTVLGASALLGVAGQTNGINNTAIGALALRNATTAAFNVGVGSNSLNNLTTGNDNTVLGFLSGFYVGSSNSTNLTSMSQSVLIGSNVRAGSNASTNEVAIGYNVVGNGSNTVTIGNNSITANYFKGDINLTGNVLGGTWSGTAISAAKGGTGLTSPGASGNILTSDGTNWVSSAPAVSGVSTLAYSTTAATNGGTISGTTLTLTAADATNPGLISTGTQTINGAKTFNNDVTAPNFLGNATTATTAGNITATSNTTLTSLSSLNTVGTITSGTWSGTTIGSNVGGAGTVNGLLKANGSGVVSAAVAGTDYQGALTAGSGISISAGTISATGLTTSNLASNAAITNAQLANSSTTLGSTTMTLGGTVTSVTGLTSVTSTGFTGSLTGNASTATKLAATKNINGVAFDGSADITIAADANTLTGTTLASNVVNSNLTGVGTITSGVWSGTAIAVAKGGTGLTSPGTSGNVLTSNGTSWVSSTPSGVNTITYTSATSYSTGGTISGTTLTLSAASATNPGLVSTGTQTFTGLKTFSPSVTASASLARGLVVSPTLTSGSSSDELVGLDIDPTFSGTGSATKWGLKVGSGGGVLVSSSTASTSRFTGALQVYGGVGVSGNVYAAGFNGANFSRGSSSTSNALNLSIGTSDNLSSTGAYDYNYAIGARIFSNNLSGSNNVGIGYTTLYALTSGLNNIGIGSNVLSANTIGSNNIAFGSSSLRYLVSATAGETDKNISIGNSSMGSAITAAENTSIGSNALSKLTTGNSNIAIGSAAGAYNNATTGPQGTSSGYLTSSTNSIFIGTMALSNTTSSINEIVIGSNSKGNGNNTTTIGNSSTTRAVIYGSTSLSNLPTTATSGNGGDFTLEAQDGFASGNTNGGNINLTPGSANGTGTAGIVKVNGQIQITGGSPGAGKVLTSDANGLASWAYGAGTTSTQSGSYSITLSDKYVFYSSSASGVATFTLPAAASNGGKEIFIKNKSAYTLTIQRSGSETIFQENSTGNSEATSITLGIESSNNWVKLVSDGTQWVVFRALF